MSNKCPKCGYVNPGGLEVCRQCASPLARVCPSCGFESPANFKYCGNCGTALVGQGRSIVANEDVRSRVPTPIPAELAEKISRVGKQIEGERRTVTILFADISGFTSLSETLDPEQVYSLVDTTLKAFTSEIYKHEGTLDKFLGDGVMALFGAPVAHEDDPTRAVLTALGMQTELQRINKDLERRLGVSLKVRIGLNSGTVVVATVGSDFRMNYTALGDAVNVASRLQTLAEPGAILVSRPVYEQTRSIFEFRELGSIRVKGRVEPVELFEVIAPRPVAMAPRGIPGLAAPMVGRREELARLRHAFEELISKRRGRIILVSGDAGIGKSRLLAEFRQSLSNKPVMAIRGACLSYGQAAYGVFLSLLRSYFGIRDDDSVQTSRDKIEQVVRQTLPPDQPIETILPYIERLLSIPIVEKVLEERVRHLDPAHLQQQTFLAVRDLLVAQAKNQPLILFFEDIHWIDKLSLDLLLSLFSVVEHVPLLIYCNSRRTEGVAASQIQKVCEGTFSSSFENIPLSPLSHADSIALVDLLLAISELPDQLKQLIPLRAEGNPFFLEEIIRMLIDRGILRRTEGRWQVSPDADLSSLEVPSTLEGLILTRVDHLSEAARLTIQYASVIGRGFPFQLLSQVAEDIRELESAIQELEDRELVHRVAPSEEREYRFRHVLIQETVSNSLLRRRREQIHRKIADGIERLYKGKLEAHVEQLAFHLAESKDHGRAFPYLLWAGHRAVERFANDQALRHYLLAAEFQADANPTPEQRVETFEGLGKVQTLTGDYDGALKSFQQALGLLERSGGAPRARAEIMRRTGRVFERLGDNSLALDWTKRALEALDLDPESQKAVERVRIYNDIGWIQYRRGKFDEAYQWRMKSLQIVEGTEYYNELASTYNGLVALFVQKGDWARCKAYAEKGLELRETIGDTYGVSQSHTNLGVTASLEGKWDQALAHFEQSLLIAEKISYVAGVSNLNNNLGILYREKGDYARSRELFQKALGIAEKIKNGNLTCQALNNLAHVQVLEGQTDRAVSDLEHSLAVAAEMDSKEHFAEAQWLLAEARLEQKRLAEAEQHAHQALKVAAEIGSRTIEGETLRALAKIARARQDLSAADEFLNRSAAVFTELKNPFELAKAEYMRALLASDRGEMTLARESLERADATFTSLGAEGERRRVREELDRLFSSQLQQSPSK